MFASSVLLETVVGDAVLSSVPLGDEEVTRLSKTRREIVAKSALVWAEHCTECVMPSCYATWALYTPRADLKCRRLDRGVERVNLGESLGVRVSFRRWGKLEAAGKARPASVARRRLLGVGDQFVSSAVGRAPVP